MNDEIMISVPSAQIRRTCNDGKSDRIPQSIL